MQFTPFIQPKIIHSFSGEPVRPRIVENQQGEYLVRTAEYWDPRTGDFIRKGVISMTKIEPKK